MKHLGDITKINGADVAPVNVVIGGSPCQDLSVAGKRAGLAGERSGLFMEQLRVIKEMRQSDANNGRTGTAIRPRFMVWENVPGAFSSNKGADFGAVLQETVRVVCKEAPTVPMPSGGWPTAGCLVDCRNGTESEKAGALQADSYKSLNCNNTIRSKGIVRRLTPLECERLQGFPDGWTQIGEVVDCLRYEVDGEEYIEVVYEYTNSVGKRLKTTDSARYKALGNSIALPSWAYVLQKLSLCCGAEHTMASLFDGIGGFPLIWEGLHGQGSCLLASEIEEFPIAVTKEHFPEQE